MSLVATPFKIVTEFAFEEIQAKSASKLAEKVEGISSAARDAQEQIKLLGTQMALQFTGLGGGIIGMFSKALRIAEDYKQTQLDLASVIGATYKMGNSAESFNKQLQYSAQLIEKIVKTADEFALDERDLAGSMMPLIGALGAKKTAGKFKGDPAEKALELSRFGAKFASSFGIDQGRAQNSVQWMTMGLASRQQMFVQKLFRESGDVLKKFGVETTDAFNALMESNPDKAVEALSAAMGKFSKDTKLMDLRVKSFTGTMTRINNLFFGLDSILKPMGNVVNRLTTDFLNLFLRLSKNHLKPLLKIIAAEMDLFFDEPKKFIERLLELQQAGKKISKAQDWTMIIVSIYHIKTLINWLGKYEIVRQFADSIRGLVLVMGGGVATILGKLGISLNNIGKVALKVILVLAKAVPGLLVYLGQVTLLFASLSIIFLGVSRATSRLKAGFIALGEKLADESKVQISIIYRSTRKIMMTFGRVIEAIATAIVGFVRKILGSKTTIKIATDLLEGLAGSMELLADIIDYTHMKIKSLGGYFVYFMGELISKHKEITAALITFDGTKLGKLFGKAHEQGMDMLEWTENRHFKMLEKDREEYAKSIIKIGTQNNNIKQDFKGAINPDRVAFSLTEHIKKLSVNPTGARGDTIGVGGKFSGVVQMGGQ